MRLVRATARTWSIINALGVLVDFIKCWLYPDFSLPARPELGLLLLYPIGMMLGQLVAWKWEGAGGVLSCGSFALFCLLFFLDRGRLPYHLFFLGHAMPGFLFLHCWMRSRGAKGIPDLCGHHPEGDDAEEDKREYIC